MAEDNLILRPVIDRAAMSRAGRVVGSSLLNATTDAMRRTARITQRLMTSSLRAAGREGGKALEQSYGAAAEKLMDAVGQAMDSVDGSIDYITKKAEDAREISVMSQNFGTNKADLYLAAQATQRSGEDTAGLVGLLGAFQDAVTSVPELANYKEKSSKNGTLDSLLEYTDKYIMHAKTPEEARQNAQIAGISPEDQKLLIGMLRELGNVSKMSDVKADRNKINKAQVNDESNFKKLQESKQGQNAKELDYSASNANTKAVEVVIKSNEDTHAKEMDYLNVIQETSELKTASLIANRLVVNGAIEALQTAKEIDKADGWVGKGSKGEVIANKIESGFKKGYDYFFNNEAKPTAKNRGEQ